MNIVPKLNLNKHPKDCDNLSLVNAKHMKVSNDESTLTVEESIRITPFIDNYLSFFYTTIGSPYKIVGVIPCNNELVIIVKPGNTTTDADIFRYQEPINDNAESMYCAYGGLGSSNRFKYQGGKIKGTFTYNVENSLVVAITEYNVPDIKIPLRTINLGNVTDPTIYNDKNIPNAKLSMTPEVKLPVVNDLDYVSGGAFKGWYYIFIRYKINTVDYTQWYSIGTPIYIDTLEQYQLIRYCYNRDTKFASDPLTNIVSPANPVDGYGAGCSDYCSNTTDIAKETFKVNLYFDMSLNYTKYQIGIVCASKSYTKAFRTADIFLDSNYEDIAGLRVQQYMLDNKSLITYDVGTLIIDNFNYYNTKNICNYQNKLYISNYLEDNANNRDVDQTIIDDINVSLFPSGVADFGVVYDTALIIPSNNGVNQYDTYIMTVIPMEDYLNIDPSSIITVSSPSIGSKTAPVGQFYIVATDNKSPAFAYVELREPGPVGSVIKTNFGKSPKEIVTITREDINDNPDGNILLDTNNLAMNGGMQYTNANINFKDRKKQSGLIPGEVYNLFIHFTNKYGHATNGYQLTNNTIWDTEDVNGVEIIPISFAIKVGADTFTYYAAMGVNENVAVTEMFGNTIIINNNAIKFYTDFVGTRLTNQTFASDVLDTFNETFSSYATTQYMNTKWYQVSFGPGENNFGLFINNNGDRLFKIPVVESYVLGIIGFPDEVNSYKTYNMHKLLRMSVSNIKIPAQYTGYYISYEKFESQRRATGLLTRGDFRSQDHITVGGINQTLGTLNQHKSDKMYFYSSIYDVSDTIKLDYNIMRFEGVNVFKYMDIPEWDYMQRNNGFTFTHDQNKPQTEKYGTTPQKTYSIPPYKVVVANSAVDNRMGVGTALEIDDAYNLFPNYEASDSQNGKIKLYRVTLLNTTRDVYMSNTKTLVRLTDIQYKNDGAPPDQVYTVFINNGYNGHYTYDGVLIYENAGMQFNTTTNKVTTFNGNDEYYKSQVDVAHPHTWQNDYPFVNYLQFPICMDVFLESKSFKNAPKPIIYVVGVQGSGDTAKNQFAKGSMVTPADSIDLFENRQGAADDFNPKTYTNYVEDLVSVEQFDKTLRRSAVIQDESRINGWRSFPVEGYKNIAENKGKITNIFGLGTMMLVHTEHSLFLFDINNTLKTKDTNVQLGQQDVFDVAYKEVFTSEKGYGGLQDDKSFAIDTFGYIFYSNDTNRIYRFDDGDQLDMIDEDILQWLNKYRPFNVRMANDKRNYRLLMKFDYIVAGVTMHTVISYYYKGKSFVSQHGYYFDESFSTKTIVYLQSITEDNYQALHSFDYNGANYCIFDNVLGSMNTPVTLPSKLSIIVNGAFDVVKFTEFLSYKLTKYVNDVNIDFTNSPVEEYIEPYAGSTLIVYNNQINTGVLDISVDSETAKNVFANFMKPYWDLGVWNFSYLRNNISQYPGGPKDDAMSRLFGNYFICEFSFNNTDNRRIDFEELNYNLSEN